MQDQHNTARDKQSYPDQERQQLCSHQHRTRQIHSHLTNTEDQLYMTSKLAYITRQHYKAPPLNQFQNHLVSQQQNPKSVQAPWKNFALNPHTLSQLQQPHMEKHHITLTHTGQTINQNPIHTNLTTDQNWQIPNQQTLQHEQRCNSEINVTVELKRQTTFEQAQLRTPYFQ